MTHHEGIPAIHAAARDGDLEAIERLIGQGADVDQAADPEERTPLHYAAGTDQVEAVRLLLKLGADPSRGDRYGYTAFDKAIHHPGGRVAGLLFDLQASADPDRFGTVLQAAVIMGMHDLVVEELKKGGDPNRRNHRGAAPIHSLLSSWEGTARLARLILSRRRGIAAPPWTPGKDRMRILETLVSHGADPNALEAGWSQVRLAAHEGDLESLRYLLEHGGTLGSERNRMALMDSTAHGGHAEVLRFLIGLGLPVEVPPEWESTPLHTAAWMGHASCVEALLNAGVDPRRMNSRGETAQDRARERLKSEEKMLGLFESSRSGARAAETREEISRLQAVIRLLERP